MKGLPDFQSVDLGAANQSNRQKFPDVGPDNGRAFALFRVP